MATLVLALSFAACVVVSATYSGRAAAQEARSPVTVPEQQAEQAIARWMESADTVEGRQYSVIYIQPLRKDAPPPPGLRYWPAPGHSAVSYGAELAGRHEGITSRYGEMDARLELEGLASLSEPLIYVRPAKPMKEGLYVSAWGNPEGTVFGEPLNIQPATGFYVLITATCLVPALALTVIACRTGSVKRDRRQSVLHAMGASRRHRLLVDLGETAPPILAGAALAVLAMYVWQGTNWNLPRVNYVMTVDYLQPHLLPFFGSAGLAALVVLTAAVTVKPRTAGVIGARPGIGQGRALVRTARWLCPVAFAVAFFGPSLFSAQDNEMLFLLPYAAGSLTALLMLPAALSALTTQLGRLTGWWGRRGGHPVALLAGRWVAASPAAVTRVVTSIVLLIGLSAQLYTWNNRTTESDAEALATQRMLDSSAVVVDGVDRNSLQQLQSFITALPGEQKVLAVYNNDSPGAQKRTRVLGGDAALRQAGLPVPSKDGQVLTASAQKVHSNRGRALLQAADTMADGTVAIERGAVATTKNLRMLQAIAPEGHKVDPPTVKHLANQTLMPGWHVTVPGDEWTATLALYREHNWWLPMFAMATLAILAFATCLANMAEFLRFSKSLAPTIVMAGNRRLFAWTTLLVFLGAFLCATLIGVCAAVVLTLPMQGPPIRAEGLPVTLIGWSVTIVITLALVMTAWAVRVALKEAGRWRPVAD
ncbi:FtsX-like permease family protein [Streptomyces uncialis]|uniref:FtsX-like permease family protein n=1 Tax=Streptomyces uncialis TaxID=1048205 RepID=UPI0011615382|nr:FtsX-like permease family protein [Streptomyces uncialis]